MCVTLKYVIELGCGKMSAKKPKVFLTLEQRVAAIKLLEQGRSVKSIADEFGCGRTQIEVGFMIGCCRYVFQYKLKRCSKIIDQKY